jgi:hypothetical protein
LSFKSSKNKVDTKYQAGFASEVYGLVLTTTKKYMLCSENIFFY